MSKNKVKLYIYLILTIVGLVIACTSIIPNAYIKLIVALVAMGYGLYGVMKVLGSNGEKKDEANQDAAK